MLEKMTSEEKEATVIMLLFKIVKNQNLILAAIALNIFTTLLILFHHYGQ